MLKRKKTHQKLGQKLVQAGKISSEQLIKLLERQQETGGYLGRLLIEGGHIREDELQKYLPKKAARERLQSFGQHHVLDMTEFYRLQTALKFTLFSDDPIKTLLITSAVPGEGKTICASYFAKVIATVREGRFLIFDADVRHPTLHNRYDVPPRPGWTDYIVNGDMLEDCFVPTDTDNLQILPAGTLPPNPAAVLASRKMKELIDKLKDMFDMVIFDSSPLLPTSDAAILGANMDVAMMVVKAGSTRRQLVRKAANLLRESNTKILGVVLNQVVDHDLPRYVYKNSGRTNGYE